MKRCITVASLGPGSPELMTLSTWNALKNAGCLLLRTAEHPVADYLRQQGVKFESFDALYDACEDFDVLADTIAAQLWERAAQSPVCYAVFDYGADTTVRALLKAKRAEDQLDVLPCVSRENACMAQLTEERPESLHTMAAIDCAAERPLDACQAQFITELNSALLAGQVKLWLADIFPDEWFVWLFRTDKSGSVQTEKIPLYTLDQQKQYDHTSCVYVPACGLMQRKRYNFEDLVRVMAILRGPGGCPWDREQTHESLRRYLLEEAYETAAAIDSGDPDHMYDELGDVLLQVVFQGAVGQSHGEFGIRDITTAICGKMIERHPHIFGSADWGASPDGIIDQWDALKQKQRGIETVGGAMENVTVGLPALMRAAKVQQKAHKVGFDFADSAEALAKVYEEADEVKAELAGGAGLAEEIGDLLFSCVNVCRLAGLEGELLLEKATDKFIRRFSQMEQQIKKDGKALEGLTLPEMDVYWCHGKAPEK